MSKIQVRIQNDIRVSGGPSNFIKTLKKDLTLSNPAYETAHRMGRVTRGIPKYIRLYEEANGHISLPRGYWENLTKHADKYNLSLECSNEAIDFNPEYPPKKLKLWDYQKPWVDGLLSSNQGVGIAPPGAGKTCMALALYASLGQPCMWITHTKRLAKQVMQRAQDFLGIEPGFIGAGKEDLAHFTVGLVPTLVRRDLSKYKDMFGLVIIDECHHVPASTFLKVLTSFNALYRYGLTATPYRDDSLEEIIFIALGRELARLDKQTLRETGKLMTPTVKRTYTPFRFPYNSMSRKYGYQSLVAALSKDIQRNVLISTDVIIETTKDENNTCIVLVGRVAHGEELKKLISPVIDSTDFVHSKLTDKESDAILDRFESGNLKVLIATYKMLAEGFDYQPSNRLFLTAPFKARNLIEQACGRVERVALGKKDAIVFDYVDWYVGVLERQANIRLDVYEVNENPVENFT